MKKHITVSLTPCQAIRLMKCLQEHGEAPLIFKERGPPKGGFWVALATTLLPVVASAAMPLVEKGVGALVKKISGGSHALPITLTKRQMDMVKQHGSGGLQVNFKSAGKRPTPGVVNAVRQLHGAGWRDNILSVFLKAAQSLGGVVARKAKSAAVSLANKAIEKGAEKAGEKLGHLGVDLIERAVSRPKKASPLDLSLFPNVPGDDELNFPSVPQDGMGMCMAGHGIRQAGYGIAQAGRGVRNAGLKKTNVPKRFVIKRV